jgi:hypothetical protein
MMTSLVAAMSLLMKYKLGMREPSAEPDSSANLAFSAGLSAGFRRVHTGPGATAFTRMPFSIRLWASDNARAFLQVGNVGTRHVEVTKDVGAKGMDCSRTPTTPRGQAAARVFAPVSERSH